MTRKLSKHELVEYLFRLREKQEVFTKQQNVLAQEINELTSRFTPKEPKSSSLITMPLIASVLREYNDWMYCSEIAEQVLRLQGQWQFVDVGDVYYQATKRILLRLVKKGLVERAGFHWRLKLLIGTNRHFGC